MKAPAGGISGVILAGGRSSRMGQDKALLPIRGRPMIEIIAGMMRSVFDTVCIAADRVETFRFLGLPVFPDIYPLCGPLGGIHAALSRCRSDRVFVSACDTPLIPPALIHHLLKRHTNRAATIALHGGNVHPLCGVYEKSALPRIEEFLQASNLKVLNLLPVIGAAYVNITPDLPFYRADLFENGNDPESFQRIARNHRT